MTNETVIEELNTLLKGTYMGIHSFEHYIQRLNEHELKKDFQSMQQDLKLSAKKIAERIQDLGGVPADNEGITGAIQGFMHNIMLDDDPKKIVKDALKGIDNYGVQYSEELVKGDLDPVSKQIVEDVIDANRRHVKQLRHFLH